MTSAQTTLRKQIWSVRPHVCNICKKAILQEQDFILDHVIARGLGGARYDWANLQILCKECNFIKDQYDYAKIHGEKIELVTKKYLETREVNNMGWTDLNKKIQEMGAKREISYKYRHDGRDGAIAKITLGDKTWTGHSNCSSKDIFNCKLGRLIALGRAYHEMKEDLSGTREDSEEPKY